MNLRTAESQRQVVSCAREKAAFAPQEVQGRGFKVEHNICLETCLRPLLEAVPHEFCIPDVEVLRLSVAMKPGADCFWMIPQKAEAVLMKSNPKKQGGRPSGSSDSGSGGGPSGGCSGGLETDGEAWASFASTADSSAASSDDRPLLAATAARHAAAAAAAVEPVEPAAPAVEDDVSDASTVPEGEGPGRGSRLPRNTHTIWQNNYFFLTDNLTSPYLQMRIRCTWLDDAHLGRLPTRKSLKPCDFGEQRGNAEQTILALKAWMIHRWQANGGIFLKKRSRLLAWGVELDNLRAAVAALGGRQRLHPGIRELIAQWVP